MDDPDLDPALHTQALRALDRINRISGTHRRVADIVLRMAAERRVEDPGSPPIRVLDVGCGDGAVLLRVGRIARAQGIAVHLHGCDLSPVALDRARGSAAQADIELTLTELDATRDPLPPGFDLVTSTLFLHHLNDADTVRVLSGMRDAGRVGLIQDLRRTRIGYVLAWAGVRLLSRSAVARTDGPLSVQGAYTMREMMALCARAGLAGAEVRRGWPERLVVYWRRDGFEAAPSAPRGTVAGDHA